MNKKVLWLSLLILMWCSQHVFCVNGSTALNFLKIGVGARAAGLGDSYCAIAEDATALYWNPAGIAQIIHSEVSFTHLIWLDNINYSYVGFVQPLPLLKLDKRAIGISVAYLTSGKIVGYDYQDTVGTDYSSYDLALGFSYAQAVNRDLFIGTTLKLVTENVELYNGRTNMMDVGVLYRYLDNLSFAGCVQNIGTKFVLGRREETIPLIVRVGSKMTISNLLLNLDLVKPIDNNLNINLGGEYNLNRTFVIRAGYKYRLGGNDLIDGINNISMGLGIKYQSLKFDYAFVPYGDLSPATHRVSLNIKFDGIFSRKKEVSKKADNIEKKEDNLNEINISSATETKSIADISSSTATAEVVLSTMTELSKLLPSTPPSLMEEALDPTRLPKSKIYIRVSDNQSKMLFNTTIKISQGESLVARAVTDEEGKYVSDELPSGKYIIKAWKEGYAAETREIEIPVEPPSEISFVLKKNK